MERIDSCRILATKIAYISNIMIYYGYVHECAELYKQLCSDSREEWNKNAKAIVKVIMKDTNLRCKLDFKGDFTHRIAKFLETNNTYNYYRIGVLLNNEGCRYLIEFIRKLDYYSEDLFYKVLIQCNKCDFYLIQRFMEVYFSQGLDKKALKLIRIPYFSKRIMYVDRLIMSIYSEIEWDIKECYTLSLNIFTFSNNNINSDIILKKNLPKLKDIKYHNLDLSVSEIKLMIDYFGDFDSERNIFESINSDSCIRLILNLKDYFRPNAEEFKIKYLAWICARFPSIKEIESNSINNIIGFTILKHIVFCEDEKYLKYLKQINKIVCKQYWSYFDQDSFIFINKLNIKLGVCINGKIAICKVNRLTINCKMESVQFTQSDLNKNQQYLLFKLDKIRFKIEGIQTDINCSEDEHSSYMKIMTNFVSESNDGRSLLFIFPIEKITIPKNINDMPILLNIYTII